ncbi:Putative F0F1-ATPase subunit (ATPase_gene1) [Rosistilla carotiformis]|uniref:F0F1-ATPase subunit (ATPase_gene1) n=1 Tax=Rosistilla carotiformis TaxID=2528017 RepID=A0A518JVY5_9BACT|nr:AtpZ/AtpI family protein [Rosistilla carotiformis]QDV69701.1 Putative F0F1-ATPase subunit (ATPase_gene1) [Rosistilla carotiformis]
MNETPEPDPPLRKHPSAPASKFADQVETKAKRKMKVMRHQDSGLWFGLGMMGLVGWSVVVPTLLGTVLGIWLDRRFPRDQSWTLMLLVAGLLLGCFNAWMWVSKEDKAMHEEKDDHDE